MELYTYSLIQLHGLMIKHRDTIFQYILYFNKELIKTSKEHNGPSDIDQISLLSVWSFDFISTGCLETDKRYV
jgi:hypothetical protein